MPDPLPWDQFSNDNPVSANSADPVVIIGAGLAGCWTAKTLAERGVNVIVLEASVAPAGGASSNPAGIVKPFVTRQPSLAMDFYVRAHGYLLQQMDVWNLGEASGYTPCGVVQMVEKPYRESAHYRCLSPEQMQTILGTHTDSHGLLFEQSGWLNPAALCRSLLQHTSIETRCDSQVDAIVRLSDSGWKITLRDKPSLTTSHLVICSGAQMRQLPLTLDLPVVPARGQLSRFPNTAYPKAIAHVISGRHYLIPDSDTIIVGATFERETCDDSIRSEDDQTNWRGLTEIIPMLESMPDVVDAYAGIRATTPDRLPLVGPIPDSQACNERYADLQHGRNRTNYPALPVHSGAYVLGGLGSRGIVTAPLAASLLADQMAGGEEISQWMPIINPARFQIRSLKRGRVT